MNKGFSKLVSVCLFGLMLGVPVRGQNYRVKAERYERGLYSLETNPASVRYSIIDLGSDVEPIRLTNSGYILLQPTKSHGLQRRWFQGQVEELKGGDEDWLVGTRDINEAGTVVGSILQYRTGTVSGPMPCPDSPSAWYRSISYGIRRAAKWTAGNGAAITISQPSFPFSIYDCTNPTGPPYTGRATFGSAWTIDDSGQIYGEALGGYAQNPPYLAAPNPDRPPTIWAWFSSGYDFGRTNILGDQSIVQNSDNTFSILGKPYYVKKVRNGVTIGYDGYGHNLVNSMPVGFSPLTMNSQGRILMSVAGDTADKFYIYDPVTTDQTYLGVKVSRIFPFQPAVGHPQMLNHRTITVTDAAGQSTTKVSPQVVGYWGRISSSFGAAIWEENAKTGQYWMQYLNRMIPADSGWDLRFARDINDNGAIVATGWFQEKDANGEPVGDPVWRACLLMPQ